MSDGSVIERVQDAVRKIRNGSRNWKEKRRAVMVRDDFTCQRCGESFSDSRPLEAAHKVARYEGGSDELDNLEALCIGCHSAVDGWDVGDFGGSANRVERVVSYVQDEGVTGAAFYSRVASLLGLSIPEAKELMEERL